MVKLDSIQLQLFETDVQLLMVYSQVRAQLCDMGGGRGKIKI